LLGRLVASAYFGKRQSSFNSLACQQRQQIREHSRIDGEGGRPGAERNGKHHEDVPRIVESKELEPYSAPALDFALICSSTATKRRLGRNGKAPTKRARRMTAACSRRGQ
jgi:hypothetical protein